MGIIIIIELETRRKIGTRKSNISSLNFTLEHVEFMAEESCSGELGSKMEEREKG